MPARPITRAKTAGSTNKRGQGGGGQPADDGPAERGRLVAALAEAQGHRHHAGDHGAARHQDRPDASLRAPRPRPRGRSSRRPAPARRR